LSLGLIGHHHKVEIAVSFTLRLLGALQSRSGRWGWSRKVMRLQTCSSRKAVLLFVRDCRRLERPEHRWSYTCICLPPSELSRTERILRQ